MIVLRATAVLVLLLPGAAGAVLDDRPSSVQVLDTQRKPVPGASVAVISERGRHAYTLSELEALAEASDLITDERGVVSLVAAGLVVVAGKRGIGLCEIGEGDEQRVIVLEAPRCLRVRVSSRSGPVAGVPVVMASGRVQWRVLADEDGIAAFEGLHLLRAQGMPRRSLRVHIDAVAAEPVSVRFPWSAIPHDDVQLRVPRLGVLRLEARFESGERVGEAAQAVLIPQSEGASPTNTVSVHLDQGVAQAFVELDLDVRAMVSGQTCRGALEGVRCSSSEEHVRAVIPCMKAHRLRTSVITVDNDPARDLDLLLRVVDEAGGLRFSHVVRTTSDGRLDVSIPDWDWQPGTDVRLVELHRMAGAVSEDAAVARATLDASGEVLSTMFNLTKTPLVTWGAVVDESGRPIGDAQVYLSGRDEPLGVVQPGVYNRGMFPDAFYMAVTSKDGVFEVRGLPTWRHLYLQATSPTTDGEERRYEIGGLIPVEMRQGGVILTLKKKS